MGAGPGLRGAESTSSEVETGHAEGKGSESFAISRTGQGRSRLGRCPEARRTGRGAVLGGTEDRAGTMTALRG